MAEAGPRRRLGKAAPLVMAAAAELPNIDQVLRVLGNDAFIFGHRGLTHSLLGAIIEVALVTGIVRMALPSLGIGVVSALAALGIGAHLLLDVLDPWGASLLAPFPGGHLSFSWVGAFDAVTWAVFGGALALCYARPAHAERTARRAIFIALAWYVVCGGSHAMAKEQLRASLTRLNLVAERIEAWPAVPDPFTWNAVAWIGDRYFQARVGALTGLRGRVRSFIRYPLPKELESPFVLRYMKWARAPLLRFVAGSYPRQAMLYDLRFAGTPGRTPWVVLLVAPPGLAGGEPTRSWMGGAAPDPEADMEFEISKPAR